MTRKTTAAGAAMATALLVAPAAALGHGSVYETTAKVASSPATNPPTFLDQQRYVVTNHGYSYVLRETNGRTARGMINYAAAPSALRTQPGYDILSEPGPQSGAQPHATCDGVAALSSSAAIRGWQDTDPFYNYVPFQASAAGLEDDPAEWIADVRTLTNIDLSTVAPAGLAAACQSLGGTFVPADQTQTTAAAFSAGTVADATRPLQGQVSSLTTRMTGMEAELARLRTGLATANDERAVLAESTRRLRLSVPASPAKSAVLASGITAALEGPSGGAVTVRLQVGEIKARSLKLASRVLGTETVLLNGGRANATIRPTAKAAAALRRAKGSLTIAVQATSGDRSVVRNVKLGG